MIKAILGKKIGMTQIFDEEGRAIPVTVIQAGPCYITQIRTPERDGYSAVQMGFEEVKSKKVPAGLLGHFRKVGVPPLRYLREFRFEGEDPGVKEGDVITVTVFQPGDKVDVTGWSKGRGFAGGIKRHGFSRQPKTHGQTDRHRAPGSRGSNTDPGHTWRGSRGPGHMGNERVTIIGLTVVKVDPEHNLIAVKGAVPGPNGGLVLIRESYKNRVQDESGRQSS